jgi:molybdenum cofactor cytidylyltransferase
MSTPANRPSPSRATRVAGVILAAGRSSRMGQNKLLLPVDGEPMVRRIAARAEEAGLSPLIVVLGHEATQVREALRGITCTFVESEEPSGPTSASLHAALREIGPDAHVDAFVVLLADMVHVTSTMIAALISSTRMGTAPLEVSSYGGVFAPPLLFRRPLWSELLAWHGDGCGKAVVLAHRDEAGMHEWPADDLQDVDTPADYEALTR